MAELGGALILWLSAWFIIEYIGSWLFHISMFISLISYYLSVSLPSM